MPLVNLQNICLGGLGWSSRTVSGDLSKNDLQEMPIIHGLWCNNIIASKYPVTCTFSIFQQSVIVLFNLLINFFRSNKLCDERLPLPNNTRSFNDILLCHNPLKCSRMLVDAPLSLTATFTHITIKILTGRLNAEYYTIRYMLLTCWCKNKSRCTWERFLKRNKTKREVCHPQESCVTYF